MAGPASPHVLRRVARTALALHGTGVTDAWDPGDVVAFRLAGGAEVWYGAVNRPDEPEGFVFAAGPRGLRHMWDLADEAVSGLQADRDVHLLTVEFVALHEVPPAIRGSLQRAGVAVAPGTAAPLIRAKPRNRSYGEPDRNDMLRIETLLGAVLSSYESDLLRPDVLGLTESIPTLTLTDESGGASPGTRCTRETHTDDLGRTEPPVRLAGEAGDWPVVDERWVIGRTDLAVPGMVVDRFDLAVVVDAESGDIVKSVVANGLGPRDLARRFARMRWWEDDDDPRFAREITFLDDGLRAELAPVLEPVGVVCLSATSHPALDRARETFAARAARLADPTLGAETGDPSGDEFAADSGGDEVELWRAAAQRLDATIAERAAPLARDRAKLREYYGPGREEIEGEAEETAFRRSLVAYVDWVAFDLRARPGAPTLAERMLRDLDDPDERALLAARIASPPSIYVIRALDPETATVTVEDVFTGVRTDVHDRSVSRSGQVGMVAPFRLAVAGPVVLAWVAGPLLSDIDLPHALDEIARHGVPPTPEGIAAKPYVLGRLFRWTRERRRAFSPEAVMSGGANTDGHRLELHEAVYAVSDGDAARRALAARADLEYETADDAFTWKRPTRPGEEAFGDNIILGRLRFIGDELLIDVNSAERYESVRAWLDRVPGVSFRGKKAATVPQAMVARKTRPLDDRLPAGDGSESLGSAMPPEVAELLGKHQEAHWRTWPDIPLPMLAGKTPREACRTPEGRAKVGAFVRTFAAPHPQIDVEPFRAMLIRDLGL